MPRADRKWDCAGGSGTDLRVPLEASPGLGSGLLPPMVPSAALERGLSALTFPAGKQRLREGKPSAWSHTAYKW